MARTRRPLSDWLTDRAVRGLIAVALALPYNLRVRFMGGVMQHVVGPVAGYRQRAMDNLGYIWPDMPAVERRRIANGVLNNAGRTLIENYGTANQLARAHRWQPHGPGFALAEEARHAGRPIIFVSGHFGNYQAARAAMNVRGYDMGGLYRPMNNPFFNEHYVRTIEGVGGPAFSRERRGVVGFVKHIRGGGQGALLIDQYFADGTRVDFMGKPAPTALSAAEMALKYDALLLPIYARRQENGLDFDVLVEGPVAHTDPVRMTQGLMDSLSAQVRAEPAQWFWVHRRWKPRRQARYFKDVPTDGAADG
jgi:KDO2-lipid IV(A) lauroyltransferase